MEKLLLIAALACRPGEQLVDLSGKIPHGLQYVDFYFREAVLRSLLYLSAWVSGQLSTMLQQQINLGLARSGRGRSILR